MTNTNDVNSTGTNTEEAKKAILAGAAIDAMAILDDASLDEDTDEDIVETQAVLSPKAIDELREILRSDETVREFFLLLKNRELRKEAIVKLNAHLAK